MAPKRTTKKTPYEPLNAVDQEWKAEDESMFGFTVSQIAIPSLVIVQPTSGRIPDKNKHIGEIYNTVTREFFRQTELAIVGWNTPRAVLPFPFDVNSPQLCASPDSVNPYPKYIGKTITAESQNIDAFEAEIPEDCGSCPFAENHLCTPMFRYFGKQMENGYPFVMRLKRTAMDGAKQLNFWLYNNEKAHRYMTFVMSTEPRPTQQGSEFYIPKFEIGRDALPLLPEMRKMNHELEDRVKRVSEGTANTADFVSE